MSNLNIVRAWKDAKYRKRLSEAELAGLPANPAGFVELTDDELRLASGLGLTGEDPATTAPTCTAYTFLDWRACGCGVETTAITCTEYTWGGYKACCP